MKATKKASVWKVDSQIVAYMLSSVKPTLDHLCIAEFRIKGRSHCYLSFHLLRDG